MSTAPWIGLVFLLALAVRLWGVNWQLPEALYYDELKYVEWASAAADGRPLAQTDFRNPSLFRHLLRAEYAVTDQLFSDRGTDARSTRRVLEARITIAMFGAAAVIFIYLTAATLISARAGLVSGLLIALSPLHVHLSHIAVNDVAAAFFLCAGLFAGARLLTAPSLLGAACAGAMAGLATAAKYNFGIVLLLPLVAVALSLLRGRTSRRRAIALASVTLACFVSGLIVAMPETILRSRDVLAGMREQADLSQKPFDAQPDAPVPLLVAETVTRSLGLPGAGAALAGAIWLARVRPSVALALLLCPAVYLAVLLQSDLFAARFALPVIPFAVIFAGWGALALTNWSRAPWGDSITLCIVVVALVAPLARDVVHHNVLATTTDTRLLAREWIDAHARGARVAAQTYSLPPVWSGRKLPDGVRVVGFKSLMDPGALTRMECDNTRYVLLASFTYERHLGKMPQPAPETGYDRLARTASLVATFSPFKGDLIAPTHSDDTAIPFWYLHAYERPGPRIEIFQLAEGASESCRRARQQGHAATVIAEGYPL